MELDVNIDQAKKLIQSGDFSNAAVLLSDMHDDVKNNPEYATMLGWALFNSGDKNLGIKVLSETTSQFPEFFEAHQVRGAVLNQSGELEQSLDSFHQAENIQPDNANLKLNIGATCIGLGRVNEALQAFSKAVELSPGNPSAYGCLANVQAELSQYEEAEKNYKRALELSPTDTQTLINYATILQGMERFEESLDLYERAEACYASSPELYRAECRSLIGLNEIEIAKEVYRMALNIFPDSSDLIEGYCYFVSKFESVEKAICVAEEFINKHGYDIRLLSLLSVLYNDSDNNELLHKYVNYSKQLRQCVITNPVTSSNSPSSNTTTPDYQLIAKVIDKILTHPTLINSPRSHATQSGSHTGELFSGEDSDFKQLKEILLNNVNDYILGNLGCNEHYDSIKPDQIKLRGWSIVMDSQGYQLSHIHPSAWLSGVCYLQLPSVIDECDDHQGWLEFGTYPEDYSQHCEPESYLIKPEVGKLILFPSYFWHRTIPYSSDTKRISLAFDIVKS